MAPPSNRGVVGGLLDSFNGIYENIVKDYVTDVYTDVIEGYSIATIKVSYWTYVTKLTSHPVFSSLDGSLSVQCCC